MLFIFYLIFLLQILIIVLPLLLSVAYFTLVERKVLAVIQRRKGPNVWGVFGLLQPLIDGFKFLIKESVIPSGSNKFLFFLAPLITFIIALIGWAVIPYSQHGAFANIDLSLLYLFAVSSVGVYGIITSGWASNSKYAFLGALRSTAQLVSYEITFSLVIICIVLTAGSFDLTTIVNQQKNCWFFILYLPLFLIFFICCLAETNRHPFDLPEAESELVSGFNVEYSSMAFALFSLAEYSQMLIMSALNAILFFGGWLSPLSIFKNDGFWFGLKICFFVVLFIVMRAVLPRYRYDQLMSLGWKIYFPVTLVCILFIIVISVTFNKIQHF